MSADEFFQYIPFCSTSIVQDKLKEKGLGHIVPDTYDEKFKDLYGRRIQKTKYKDLDKVKFPYFIKSAGNNKLIDGTVVNDKNELDEIWVCNPGPPRGLWAVNDIKPWDDMELYTSDIVKFEAEYRLLVGNKHVYGCGFQRGNNDQSPSDLIVDKILQIAGEQFLCVDVGYDGSQWIIVEINPPFSLDDFGISLSDYIQYATDFWTKLEANMLILYCEDKPVN